MKKNKAFWKNKKILITGFEGFLGSHLSGRFLSYGASIIGIDCVVRRKKTILEAKDYRYIKVIKGDVADYFLVAKTIKENKIEYVFHLAAEAIVDECFKNPLKAFASNIQGTWNLLEACRGVESIKAIVIASSDKAYGSHNKLPYKESYSLQGKHPYDVSKSCADLLARAYFHTFNVPVVVTRCGNIFGPGEYNFSRIVPDSIRSILANKPIIIRSDGNFVRDFVFVEDVVDGYLLLAQKVRKMHLEGEAFNFSAERPITVIELVKKICQCAGKNVSYKILNQVKYEIKKQYLSAKKARKLLSWKPGHSLETGLKKTISWYRDLFKSND